MLAGAARKNKLRCGLNPRMGLFVEVADSACYGLDLASGLLPARLPLFFAIFGCALGPALLGTWKGWLPISGRRMAPMAWILLLCVPLSLVVSTWCVESYATWTAVVALPVVWLSVICLGGSKDPSASASSLYFKRISYSSYSSDFGTSMSWGEFIYLLVYIGVIGARFVHYYTEYSAVGGVEADVDMASVGTTWKGSTARAIGKAIAQCCMPMLVVAYISPSRNSLPFAMFCIPHERAIKCESLPLAACNNCQADTTAMAPLRCMQTIASLARCSGCV